MSDYRQKLVGMVEETGRYITAHADELIDRVDWKSDVTFWIRFASSEVPTIEVQQTHAIIDCLKVRTGE